MQISFLLPSYLPKPSGGYRVIYEYANQLVSRGHGVTVIHPLSWHTYSWPRKKRRYLRSLIVKPQVRWQAIDRRVNLLFIPEPVLQFIPDADVIVATAWETADVVLNMPKSKGQRMYFIQHYEDWSGSAAEVDATWRAPMKKVVIAQWLFDKGITLGVPREDMVRVPNGINHDLFRMTVPFEDRKPKATMLFADAEWKGGADGIAALELARKQYPSLSAILFGVSKKPKTLPSWIEYARDPEQSFLVDRIYNESSIFLCPSWSEGFGLPAAESMACGCAVVSTDNGGISDYAEDGKTALLSPPKQPNQLAKHMLQLLQNDSLRTQLARAGHERIQEFTWPRSADLFEQVLREL
jgi:glycosyltransferase involved in cell wall biosynthesis